MYVNVNNVLWNSDMQIQEDKENAEMASNAHQHSPRAVKEEGTVNRTKRFETSHVSDEEERGDRKYNKDHFDETNPCSSNSHADADGDGSARLTSHKKNTKKVDQHLSEDGSKARTPFSVEDSKICDDEEDDEEITNFEPPSLLVHASDMQVWLICDKI